MSDTTSHSIRVQVTPEFLPEQSSPQTQRFVFAYHVEISNLGNEAVQLIDRHWLITNGQGEMEEVHGDGVVGLQPVIHPGERFSYSSACPLATPVGTMEGHYGLRQLRDGAELKAHIGIFRLAMPGALH